MRIIALFCLISLAVQAEKPSFKKWKMPLALGIASGITYNPFAKKIKVEGNIQFNGVDFTYSHTGIEALKKVN